MEGEVDENEEKNKERMKRNSRRSSAYVAARRQALRDGKTMEEAKELGRAVS